MAEVIAPQTFRSFHRGMADATVLSDSLMPANQMRLVLNMDADAIGFLTGRKGYARLGSAAPAANTGQGILDHDGTNPQIIVFVNGESYYLVGSTWTNKSLGFSTTAKIHSVSFLDYAFAVNGVNENKSWTGAAGASWGTTNLASSVISSLIETYKQQMFLGNTSTDTVYFSSVPSSSSMITWPAANNFIVNPNDGANLTAFKRYGKELLIFKENYTYRFNGRSIDADPVIFFGAASQEAVVVAAATCWFYDSQRDAILGYAGGYPTIVSKPIRSFLKAIPTSSRDDVALRSDDDHVEAFIGNVTVDGVAFTNVACRYTISTQVWTLRSYANTFNVFGDYDNGTTLFNLGITSVGDVVEMDTGNDDLATTIKYDLQTAWITIGGNPAVKQKLAGFAAFMENGRAMTCYYKTDIDPTWRPIGQINQFSNSWSGINAQFHRIKLRFTGVNVAEPAVFDGFSILIPVIEGVEKSTERPSYA